MRKILLAALALFTIAGSGFAQNLPSYVPANGLVGWWPFNGNANDESGNGNNGMVNSATLTSDRFGSPGKAYHFDGINDYVNCGNNANLQLNNFSISIWSSLDSSSNWSSGVNGGGFFLQKGCDNPLSPNNGFSYRIYYQNPFGLISDNFTSNRVALENTLTGLFQKWNHIVFTYNNSQLKLFLNGEIVDSISRSGTTAINNDNLLIGCRKELINSFCTLNDYFTGQLDDIGIWNRALSQQEITALYQGGNTTTNCLDMPSNLKQGLVGYWPFCGNALDESGNGNHGTVNGATLTTDRFGNQGSAYSFDGVTSNVQIPNSSSLSNLDSITISAWVKINSWFILPGNNSNFFPILNKSNSSENGKYSLYLTQNNGNAFQFGNQNVHNFQFSFGLDNWYHIVCRFSGGQYSSFVNGILVNGNNFPFAGALNNNLPLVFGKDASGEVEYSNGSLDDIAIWNRALTQEEITQLNNLVTSSPATTAATSNSGFRFWPNPSQGNITIDAGNLTPVQGWKYKVANTLGQTVVNETAIIQQQTLIDLSTRRGNGIYYLHLINPQGHITEVKKIVLAP